MMPNWCFNILHISGPTEILNRFKKQAEGPEQIYNSYDGEDWPAYNDIRIRMIWENLPVLRGNSVFSFHALYPVPDHIRRLPYDENQARKICEILRISVECGGYNWELQNWGIKWGASDAFLELEEPEYLRYVFETPWGPPLSFLKKVSKDWPDLNFNLNYKEPGMNFEGEASFCNGDDEDSCWEIEHNYEGSE